MSLGLGRSKLQTRGDLSVALKCLLDALAGVFTTQGTSYLDSPVTTILCFLLSRGCFHSSQDSCEVQVCADGQGFFFFQQTHLFPVFKLFQQYNFYINCVDTLTK